MKIDVGHQRTDPGGNQEQISLKICKLVQVGLTTAGINLQV